MNVNHELARGALVAARVDAPDAFPVSWVNGRRGGVAHRETLRPREVTQELRAMLAKPLPKGAGYALLPAETDATFTTRQRADVLRVSMVIVDFDRGGVTMGEAMARASVLGFGGWWLPSTSAPATDARGVDRWRWLLPLASDTAPETYALAGPALALALETALDLALDRSTYRPEALTFIHPAPHVGPRPPVDVHEVDGGALDVVAFLRAATDAGWWSLRDLRATSEARKAGVRDGAALVALLDAAGYILDTPGPRGFASFMCPRAQWHGASAARRGDTSCAIHVASGAVSCKHDHSGAPEGERGPARTARILRWIAADHPELAPSLFDARDLGALADARDALDAPPFEELPRRVVHPAAVADDVREAMARAVKRGALVLYTPTTGAGKSRGIGGALDLVARDVSLMPRDDAANPKASAWVLVKDRASISDVCESVARVGLAARVYTPAHEVERPDGGNECLHPKLALSIYRAGGSALASLCPAVPNPSGSAPCERLHEGCPARDRWVPWLLEGGMVRPAPWATPDLGVAWVAVATFASAQVLLGNVRRGAPGIVDEADPALSPVVFELDADALGAALQWAGRLAPSRVDGRPCGALRIASVVIAAAAMELGPEGLAAIEPTARVGWCAELLRTRVIARGERAELARWVGSDGDVMLAAAQRWCADALGASFAVSVARGLAEGASELRALVRWARGAFAALTTRPTVPPSLVVAWRSDAAELVASVVLEGGGGVLALDATGTPSIAAAAVGAHASEHDPVRVEGGADVARVLVSTSRAGRGSLTPLGRVAWANVLPALRALAGALAAVRRDGCGIGEGVVFAARPLALACAALARGVSVEVLPGVARLTSRQRAEVDIAVRDAPDEVRALLVALGPAAWSHFGGTDARGSNVHRARTWSATLGDARPPPDGVRLSLLAQRRAEPDDVAVRRACDRIAAAEHAQCHGRLRAVRRDGERLAMIHVGRVPPLDWHELQPAPRVVSIPGAIRWGASQERDSMNNETPQNTGEAAKVAADEVLPIADNAHAVVRAAAAAGWSLGALARATGCERNAVRAWWRGEGTPRARSLRILAALASGEGAPALRMQLRAMTAGRGFGRVWSGACGVEGLAQRLAALGVRVKPFRVRRWMDIRDAVLEPEIVEAIARVLPDLVRVFPAAAPRVGVLAEPPVLPLRLLVESPLSPQLARVDVASAPRSREGAA